MSNRKRACAGFTLIELSVVLVLIAIMLGVALPRLLPMVAFSRHENAARHLATYGRSTIAYCSLRHENITVSIDLDKQEYYAVRYDTTQDETTDQGHTRTRLFDSDSVTQDDAAQSKTLAELIKDGEMDGTERTEMMRERFDQFVRVSLEARIRNMKSDSFLEDIGPKFDKFSLDTPMSKDKDAQEKADLITYPTLSKAVLPEGIRIAKVTVGQNEFIKGIAEIPVSPIGMAESVRFVVIDEKGEAYTVVWDPITAGGRIYEGERYGS